MSRALADAERALCARESSLIELRRDLHRQPELAFEEHRTAALVAARLAACGLEVRQGVAGTGVVAVLRGAEAGPTVAWRADMDALPIDEPGTGPFSSTVNGVMHACGHDGHTALAVTVAEALAGFRTRVAGTLVFLFQPAEEVFGGAGRMLAEGVLDAPHVDEVFGLHLTTHLPPGHVAIGSGIMWAAADVFEIELLGQGAHGAYPHMGRSPLPAAASLVLLLQSLVAQEVAAAETAVLSIGCISAGERPNVIPDRARVGGSLRTLSDATGAALKTRIEQVAHGVAGAHGVEARVRFEAPCLPLRTRHPGSGRGAREHALAGQR
jgi:amidohydrolase